MHKNVLSCKFQPFNVVKQGKTLMQILIVPHKKSRIAAQSSTFAEFMSLQEKNSWHSILYIEQYYPIRGPVRV